MRSSPDFGQFFHPVEKGSTTSSSQSQLSTSDFAIQLSYLVAYLTATCPPSESTHQWIHKLSKFEFSNASVSLCVSIPGLHWQPWIELEKRNENNSKSPERLGGGKLLGTLTASVLGIKHAIKSKPWIHSALISISHGFGLFLSPEHNWISVNLVRLPLHQSDPNAVAVVLKWDLGSTQMSQETENKTKSQEKSGLSTEEMSGGKSVALLGFLGRNLVQWLAPIIDLKLVEVDARLDRQEAIIACSGQAENITLGIRLFFFEVIPKFWLLFFCVFLAFFQPFLGSFFPFVF